MPDMLCTSAIGKEAGASSNKHTEQELSRADEEHTMMHNASQ